MGGRKDGGWNVFYMMDVAKRKQGGDFPQLDTHALKSITLGRGVRA
jgi:hypothetical protein